MCYMFIGDIDQVILKSKEITGSLDLETLCGAVTCGISDGAKISGDSDQIRQPEILIFC